MEVHEPIVDAYGRARGVLHRAVEGLTPEQLAYRPDPGSNSIAWLAWHLTRVQDDHVADVAGTEQQWTAGGWLGRFALPFEPAVIGFGHGPDDVAAVRVPAADLLAYHDAVHDHTVAYVGGLRAADLDRIVDERWDPPVSLGVRLVSVIADNLQHAGQAAYLRGLVGRGAG